MKHHAIAQWKTGLMNSIVADVRSKTKSTIEETLQKWPKSAPTTLQKEDEYRKKNSRDKSFSLGKSGLKL